MDNSNVFLGIIIGLIAAFSLINLVKLNYLWPCHFSGKRLVPIMTVFLVPY